LLNFFYSSLRSFRRLSTIILISLCIVSGVSTPVQASSDINPALAATPNIVPGLGHVVTGRLWQGLGWTATVVTSFAF